MKRRKLLFVMGTRPDAIKMIPILKVFEKSDVFDIEVCVTSQHTEMLGQVLDFFKVKAKFDLSVMIPNQSLFCLTSNLLKGFENVLYESNPDCVFVQGDTTSSFVGALASFYGRVRVAHIEAGLRSFDKYSPFPEEMNRVLISRIADFHFAPTKKAAENLKREGIKENVWVVGNTVIDALYMTLDFIEKNGEEDFFNRFNFVDFSKKIILVTMHRRENFGTPMESVCDAIVCLKQKFDNVEFVFPVHLNPNVREVVFKKLANVNGVHLIEPLAYPSLVWLMSKCHLVLTDSGGIQEEAPSLGKPVLVLRDVTERTEGIEAETARIVGLNMDKIVKETANLLLSEGKYKEMSEKINPYGDGKSAERIFKIVLECL